MSLDEEQPCSGGNTPPSLLLFLEVPELFFPTCRNVILICSKTMRVCGFTVNCIKKEYDRHTHISALNRWELQQFY